MSAPRRAEQAENKSDVDEREAFRGECLGATGGQQERNDLASGAQHDRDTAKRDPQAGAPRRGVLRGVGERRGKNLPKKKSQETTPGEGGRPAPRRGARHP